MATVNSMGNEDADSSVEGSTISSPAASSDHGSAPGGDDVPACAPAAYRPRKSPIHRITAPGSVQALVIDDDVVFAGMQGGAIVGWSLDTYELLATVSAHKESVLGLALSDDKSLLFSSGADAVVNVWSTQTLQRLYALHSQYEIGDVFSVTYSSKQHTLLWGAQNSSIQWYRLRSDSSVASPTPAFAVTPGSRKHRFFDSLGPGGTANAIPDDDGVAPAGTQGGVALTLPARNYLPYAHKSYVYATLLVKRLAGHDRDDEIFVTGGGDGTIRLWSLDALNTTGLVPMTKFKNPGANVLSLASKGSFLYAGLSDGVANIYNLASNQLVQKLTVPYGDISQILVSHDSVFCGTSQGWIKRFNDRFLEIECWRGAQGKILAMASTTIPDHDLMATGSNDKLVSFWDATPDAHASVRPSGRSNDELVNALREFVAYRTVALNPTCVRDCHDAVAFVRKLCNAFGATTALASPQDGVNPILVAKFSASTPSASTKSVLFYGHYDVVDAELDATSANPTWHADPFNLQPQNGFLYGRGVTDNKGPVLAAIYAVADLVQTDALSCNVTFLLEGDEEAGSRGFRKAVQSMHDAIGPVDFVLLSNSYWLDDHIPCLTFGMRGVIHASVTISSNKPDLHSGMDGKAVQHEPLKDLTVILASLMGPTGTKIMIPNFYDAVDDLSKTELQSYAAITSALLPGHHETKREKAFAVSLMQRWRYPNLTVHRIEVPEAKTAVTISGSAKATLSIRIVPSQTAEQVAASLTQYLQAQFSQLNSSNSLDVNITSRADPWLGDVGSQIFTALKAAIVEVWDPTSSASHRSFQHPLTSAASMTASPTSISNPSFALPPAAPSPSDAASPQLNRSSKRRASALACTGTFRPDSVPREPLFIREGGSIPAISFLEREFDAPAAMFPMGQASDNAHLDNERIRVENLYKGREVLKRVFGSL